MSIERGGEGAQPQNKTKQKEGREGQRFVMSKHLQNTMINRSMKQYQPKPIITFQRKTNKFAHGSNKDIPFSMIFFLPTFWYFDLGPSTQKMEHGCLWHHWTTSVLVVSTNTRYAASTMFVEQNVQTDWLTVKMPPITEYGRQQRDASPTSLHIFYSNLFDVCW